MNITYIDIGLHKEAKEIRMMLRILEQISLERGEEIPFTVYGYEAHPSYAQRLELLFSEDPRIHIRNAAICSHSGTVNLYLSPASDGEGNSIFSSKNNVLESKSIEVPARRMSDELFQIVTNGEIGDITILRFNIEGAELEMMEDLIGTGSHELIDIYCGAASDIPKVAAISHKYDEYQDMLTDAGIHFQYFHAHYIKEKEAQMEAQMKAQLISLLDTASSHTSTQEH